MADYVFQGSAELTLDGKGRVTVSSRHRDTLAALSNGEVTLTKAHSGCLLVFPRPAWIPFRESLLRLPMSAEDWRRVFIGSATDLEMDGSSRLLVPPELRSFANLVRDVTMVGMGHRLELWDRDRLAAREAKTLASEMPQAIQDFVG